MSAWLTQLYPWAKALHIVAVISWLAGLLYLPRLYVYHAMAPVPSDTAETFKLMERRLLRGIMGPAIVLTYVFGAVLAATPGAVDWRHGWIWAKLGLVGVLTLFHHALARWRRAFAEDRNCHSARFFRIANELPALVMLVIVVLVVVKPF